MADVELELLDLLSQPNAELTRVDPLVMNLVVARITMENTPVSNVTAAEIARLIKIGGTIFILTTVDGRKDHDRVIAAIGGRGSIDQAISNNVLTTTIRIR